MTQLVHALAGAAAALVTNKLLGPQHGTAARVLAASCTSAASHFALDALPHLDIGHVRKTGIIGDVGFHAFLVAELVLAIVVLYRLTRGKDWATHAMFIWLGALWGWSPDLPGNAPLIKDWTKSLAIAWPYLWFHSWIHSWWQEARFPMIEFWRLGLATQAITMLASLACLLEGHRFKVPASAQLEVPPAA